MIIEGHEYNIPCNQCRDKRCGYCAFSKLQEVAASEKERRVKAEFKVEHELEPRIEQEKRAYDRFVMVDRAETWSNDYGRKIDDLVDMFDEDFVSQFDFDGDDIASKIGRLIMQEKEATR